MSAPQPGPGVLGLPPRPGGGASGGGGGGAVALFKQVTITATGATTFTVPPDWNNTGNTVECIGGGGGGHVFGGNVGTGGEGGHYTRAVNVSLAPGAVVNVNVGAGGTPGSSPTKGGDTWFANNNTASVITSPGVVSGGLGGAPGSNSGSQASTATTNDVGSVIHAGGTGGSIGSNNSGSGGGGGAAGRGGVGGNGAPSPNAQSSDGGGGGGAGNTGGAGGSTVARTGGASGSGVAGGAVNSPGLPGGSGGGGSLNSSGDAGGAGGVGTDSYWTANGGFKGGPGGGGGGGGSGQIGGAGGLYGGGGGGGQGSAGGGAQGLIVITYAPVPSTGNTEQTAQTSSPVAVTGSAQDFCSLTLAPGNWLVFGTAAFVFTAGATNNVEAWISESSAVAPTPPCQAYAALAGADSVYNDCFLPTGPFYASLPNGGTVYLSGVASGAGVTGTVNARIDAVPLN